MPCEIIHNLTLSITSVPHTQHPSSLPGKLDLLNRNFALVDTSHGSIFPVEKFCNFLERWSLGFNEQEPDAQYLDHQNDDIHKIEFPLQVLETDRIYVSATKSTLLNVGRVTTYWLSTDAAACTAKHRATPLARIFIGKISEQ
jgi:hypothetical protein